MFISQFAMRVHVYVIECEFMAENVIWGDDSDESDMFRWTNNVHASLNFLQLLSHFSQVASCFFLNIQYDLSFLMSWTMSEMKNETVHYSISLKDSFYSYTKEQLNVRLGQNKRWKEKRKISDIDRIDFVSFIFHFLINTFGTTAYQSHWILLSVIFCFHWPLIPYTHTSMLLPICRCTRIDCVVMAECACIGVLVCGLAVYLRFLRKTEFRQAYETISLPLFKGHPFYDYEYIDVDEVEKVVALNTWFRCRRDKIEKSVRIYITYIWM